MVLIFEDNLDKFPYELIPRYFSVIGCRGVRNIKRNLQDNAIVFVDVVPDNPVTFGDYVEIIDAAENFENIFVFPIPCIEYIFIRAFGIKDTVIFNNIMSTCAYKIYNKNYRERTLCTNMSFEKFCKSIIKNEKSCLLNRQFERKDCSEDCRYFTNCQKLSLDIKRSRMCMSFPFYLYNLEDVTAIKSALEGQYDFYDALATNFLKYGYIDRILRLPRVKQY